MAKKICESRAESVRAVSLWIASSADFSKVAMAKLYASEMAGRVADRAVQIHGGRGYMHENAAARFFREVRVDRIWEGTSEIQKLIIARGLQKRGAAPYLGWESVSYTHLTLPTNREV